MTMNEAEVSGSSNAEKTGNQPKIAGNVDNNMKNNNNNNNINNSVGNNNNPNNMNETGVNNNKSQNQRPKSVLHWSVVDVQKWLRRHCGDYFHLYCETFLEQDITGRSLVRMSEHSLMRLGIIHPEHRHFILREIGKLRLRSAILHLRDQERRMPTANIPLIEFPQSQQQNQSHDKSNAGTKDETAFGDDKKGAAHETSDRKEDTKKEKKSKEDKLKQDK